MKFLVRNLLLVLLSGFGSFGGFGLASSLGDEGDARNLNCDHSASDAMIERGSDRSTTIRNPPRLSPIEGTYGDYVKGGLCAQPGQYVLDGIIVRKIAETVFLVTIVRPRNFQCNRSGKEKNIFESVSGEFDLVDGFLISRMRNALGYKIKFNTRNRAFSSEKVCDEECKKLISHTSTRDIEFDDKYGLFSIDSALFKITTAPLLPYSQP